MIGVLTGNKGYPYVNHVHTTENIACQKDTSKPENFTDRMTDFFWLGIGLDLSEL